MKYTASVITLPVEGQPAFQPSRGRTLLQRIGRPVMIGLAGLVSLIAAGIVSVHLTVDAAFVENYLNRTLATASRGHYRATVESAGIPLFGRSLSATGITIVPDTSEIARSNSSRDTLSRRRYSISIPRLSLTDVSG